MNDECVKQKSEMHAQLTAYVASLERKQRGRQTRKWRKTHPFFLFLEAYFFQRHPLASCFVNSRKYSSVPNGTIEERRNLIRKTTMLKARDAHSKHGRAARFVDWCCESEEEGKHKKKWNPIKVIR